MSIFLAFIAHTHYIGLNAPSTALPEFFTLFFLFQPKLWPRGCAFAERLWTDPQETGWREAEQRLLEHRRRLVHERGLHADAMMPEFCR